MDSLPGGQIYGNWTRLQKLIWSYLKNNLFVLYFYKCYNCTLYFAVNSRHLKVEVHLKILIHVSLRKIS